MQYFKRLSSQYRHFIFAVITCVYPGLLLQRAIGQTPHPEVLVVHNSNFPESLTVAQHYMAQRNVPVANLCAITPPSANALSLSDYTTFVKTPIQNCLNTVGQKNILYIVMSYQTPFAVSAGPMDTSAIDSYLADIWNKYVSQPFLIVPSVPHGYYADSQSQGNVYQPFVPFAAYRANPRSTSIYSVWRLDAPSAALASALVDQAIAAETAGGPTGQACIDRRFGDITGQPDSGYNTADWDLRQAAALLQQAGIAVTEDANEQEFGTPPAPATCPNTAYFSGWYSLNHYNDAFTWQNGSIGWHLDSESVLSPRGGASWVPNALLRGIAVTSGAVAEPYLQGLVRAGGAFRNLLEGANVGDAFLRNTRWLKWQILNIGDPLYRPFGSGRAPFSPLQPVNSFQIFPQELVGGRNSTGTITLSAPAGPGGVTFTLTQPGNSLATIPPNVTVLSGATKATFPITTAATANSQSPVIAATGTVGTLRNTLVIDPLMGALVPSSPAASAGMTVTVTVMLNDRAPIGGALVTLSSDNPAIAPVPASITVPAGTGVATFDIPTVAVPASQFVHISGSYGGATAGFDLAVQRAISSVELHPATVIAGIGTEIDIFLALPAPAGGATVQLTSSDITALPVPATVTIAPGAIFGHTVATTTAGSGGKTVLVTGTYAGGSASATLTIQ